MAHCGLINLHKPPGATSRQVVDRLQRLARPDKVGHAGTLDPLATGVLVLCVGAATRLIQHVQQMPKGYLGTFLLGRRSPSEDVDGEVTLLDDPPVPGRRQILQAAGALMGRIEQRPPAFSALKVAGRRAYDLARRGEHVELKPRRVTVHRIEVLRYEYPELVLRIDCGSGTYVRSLGRDLAESLGTAAVMSALVRTAVGGFRLEEAVDPDRLDQASWTDHLLPPLRAVERLPRIELSAQQLARVRGGQTIPRGELPPEANEIAAVDTAGRLAAILTARGKGLLGPLRNLPLEDEGGS